MSTEETLLRNKTRLNKLCEGWLEYKSHKPNGNTWEKIWVVLKANVLYIFKTDNTKEENQMGNLTLDRDTSFTIQKIGDARKGFQFELSTGKRLNKFKSKMFSERELWRGYIVGVSQGKVPEDIDLLSADKTALKRDIDLYLHGPLPQTPSVRHSTVSVESGMGSMIDGISGFSVPYPTNRSGSLSGSGSQGSGSTLDNGGPTMIHKFFNDRSRGQKAPSWFFSHCSRQVAEAVLTTAKQYGNTLMRESTSHKDNGSYVISKMIWNERRTEPMFEHYEVMRTAGGYKVNVENPHDPMKCLSQVMEYFIQTSGENTIPMTTNDMKALGLETPNYEKTIYRRSEPQPEAWVWPPPGPSSESPYVSKDFKRTIPTDIDRDYDQPTSPRSPTGHSSSRHDREHWNTVSPGILKKQTNGFVHKSVGFTPTSNSKQAHHTFAGSGRSRISAPPTMHEIADRSNAAAHLQTLDNAIAEHDTFHGFDQGQLYVNDPFQELHQHDDPSSRQRPDSFNTPPPPPPPPPQNPAVQHSYVNGIDSESKDTLDKLPVAPPAPRVPIPSSGPRMLNNNSASTATKSTSRSTSDPAFSHSPISTSMSPVKTVHSVGQFIGSPNSFPTWNGSKKNTSNSTGGIITGNSLTPVKSDNSANVSKTNTAGVDDTIPGGVDDTTPGGVMDLRSRFEVKAPPNSSNNVANMRKKGMNHVGGLLSRHSTSAILTRTAPADVYEDMPSDYINAETGTGRGHSSHYHANNTNAALTIANTNPSNNTVGASLTYTGTGVVRPRADGGRINIYLDETEEDVYDDTVNPTDNLSGKVHFQTDNTEPTPPSADQLRKRRQTEPTLPTFSPAQFEGLNESFKQRLEGLFGGSPTSPTGPVRRPLSGVQRQISVEDHEYAELPEGLIPPDEVTYENEKYNRENT